MEPGDPHYVLTTVPDGETTVLQVRSEAGGYPIPPWIGDDASSAWIGPNNDALVGSVGIYSYRTTFDLTGFHPETASLSGLWSRDNQGLDILINGISTGTTVGTDDQHEGFVAWSSFVITSGFIEGVNTLDFVVSNGGGPTGLRVQVSGTADAPEPASLVLFGAGLAGLGLLRRRQGSACKIR